MTTCTVEACGLPHHAKGWCRKHWERWRATGTTRDRFDPASVAQRFWARVQKGSADDCWPWQGSRHHGGYGRVRVQWRQMQAHRLAYELARGAISAGLTLDHLCNNPPCCNPAHLEPVTAAENLSRAHRRRKAALQRNGATP